MAFLKRNEPATRTVAPAPTQTLAVSSLMPPSTEISREGLFSAAQLDTAEIFSTHSDMNACPPKPGLTVMIRTMSTIGIHLSISSTGVSGFTEIPALSPRSRILSTAAPTSPVDSQCTVIPSQPASAKSST